MKCIVVCAGQRSGTTVLRKTFGSTVHFHDYSEVFHHQLSGSKFNFFNYVTSSIDRMKLYSHPTRENMTDLLKEYLLCLEENSPKSYFFIDVKYNSAHNFDFVWHDPLSKPNLINLLEQFDIPILHIKRDNIFSQAMSTVVATKTGKWHVSSESELEAKRITVNPNQILLDMKRIERLNSFFNEYLVGYPTISEITYENMFLDGALSSSTLSAIEDLTGVCIDTPLKPVLTKINKSVSSKISNINEVLEFFSGSPYEKYVKPILQG